MEKIILEVVSKKTLKDLERGKRVEPQEPLLTKEKVEAAFALLIDVEANNGFVSIAQAVGLSADQVKSIRKAMDARLGELMPTERVEV